MHEIHDDASLCLKIKIRKKMYIIIYTLFFLIHHIKEISKQMFLAIHLKNHYPFLFNFILCTQNKISGNL